MSIQNLPFEMIVTILDHLETPKKTTFDQKLHLVCKDFFRACHFLELSKLNQGSPNPIRSTIHPLAKILKAGHSAIKDLTIRSTMNVEEMGKFFIKNKEIKSLKISTSISSSFEINYLLQKLKHLPLLENVDMQFYSRNEFIFDLHERGIIKIIDSCPKLKSFSLDVPSWESLISSDTLEAFSKLNNLEVLKLKRFTLPLDFNGTFTSKFPMLKEISISNQRHFLNINTILENAPNITSCNIAHSEFGVREINEEVINNLKKFRIDGSFRLIVDEGMFNLEKIHFVYNEMLEEYCREFENFPNLKSVIISPSEDPQEEEEILDLDEIQNFAFKNDITLTLCDYILSIEDFKNILLNKKIKNLVLLDTILHADTQDEQIKEHSLQSITLKGNSHFIEQSFNFFNIHFTFFPLVKSINIGDSEELTIQLINQICNYPNLEELKINFGEVVLKGKNEIFSYMIYLLMRAGYDADELYRITIQTMLLQNHPLKDVLNFIVDHQIEERITELNIKSEITGLEHRLLKLPNLTRMSFVENGEYLLEKKEVIQEFLTNRLPLIGPMLGKRKNIENMDKTKKRK